MPLSLSNIIADTAQVTVQIPSGTFEVTYYPAKITEKTFAQLQGFSNMDENAVFENFKVMNSILCSVVKSWGLYEDDAQTQMIPITPERLAELPIYVRLSVIGSVLNSLRPEALAPQIQN